MREFALIQLKLSSSNVSLSIPRVPSPFAKPASKQKVKVGAQSAQPLTIPVAEGTGSEQMSEAAEEIFYGCVVCSGDMKRGRNGVNGTRCKHESGKKWNLRGALRSGGLLSCT